MAKTTTYTLKTMTDIKVFMLFLLDTIRYPIDYTTLRRILFENTGILSTEYDEGLDRLIDEGHVITDEIDGERYMMISETGRRLCAPLYDTLDATFREQSARIAAKHLALSKRGLSASASIREDDAGRFTVTLTAEDRFGKLMELSLSMNSRAEAEHIRTQFEVAPDRVYRSLLFASTGRIELLS